MQLTGTMRRQALYENGGASDSFSRMGVHDSPSASGGSGPPGIWATPWRNSLNASTLTAFGILRSLKGQDHEICFHYTEWAGAGAA